MAEEAASYGTRVQKDRSFQLSIRVNYNHPDTFLPLVRGLIENPRTGGETYFKVDPRDMKFSKEQLEAVVTFLANIQNLPNTETRPMPDPVNHPDHYNVHPSGIECIQITEHMGFNLGNAVKYIWRCDLKEKSVEDLEKAQWYLQREINKRRQVRGLKTPA